MALHVVPLNDLREHNENGADDPGYSCPCNPAIEFGDEKNETLVIHHSFDGRELLEPWGKYPHPVRLN